jgi:hypothetical protein
MNRYRHISLVCLLLGALLIAACSSATPPAIAAHSQLSMFEDDALLAANPSGTLLFFRRLGVGVVRMGVRWPSITPSPNSHRRPHGFNATNPAAYPARNWAIYDTIVRYAAMYHVQIEFDVGGGAPVWAQGPGAPTDKIHWTWKPSPSEFRSFMHALGTRYSGNYNPSTRSISPGNPNDLPAVRSWSIWNEPDYGPTGIAPQVGSRPGVEGAAVIYRNLVDAAWNGLTSTGHRRDMILFGEVAPRGEDNFGVFNGMKPLRFVRAMYCVDSSYRQLRGTAARLRSCPTSRGGSANFRNAHPALFQATGFADHPYSRWYPPNVETAYDPDYSSLAEIGRLEGALDRVQRAYGSNRHLPIYDTEYGYITSPPKHRTRAIPYVSPSTAAYYINWAEYLKWRDPRFGSSDQYLLRDPLPSNPSTSFGGFASGLQTHSGQKKATYDAYRLALYLPVTSSRRGRSLEVWGCVRPAPYVATDTGTPQSVQIEFQPGSRGAFTTLQSVQLPNQHSCYFDLRMQFPGSGTVRLAWTYPTSDPFLSADSLGVTVVSRYVQLSLH